jgi:hypothetical protein
MIGSHVFVEQSSTKERSHQPTHPKVGKKCKNLQECKARM